MSTAVFPGDLLPPSQFEYFMWDKYQMSFYGFLQISRQAVIYFTVCCYRFHVVSANVSSITISMAGGTETIGETQNPSGCGP